MGQSRTWKKLASTSKFRRLREKRRHRIARSSPSPMSTPDAKLKIDAIAESVGELAGAWLFDRSPAPTSALTDDTSVQRIQTKPSLWRRAAKASYSPFAFVGVWFGMFLRWITGVVATILYPFAWVAKNVFFRAFMCVYRTFVGIANVLVVGPTCRAASWAREAGFKVRE